MSEHRTERAGTATLLGPPPNHPILPQAGFRDAPALEQLTQLVAALLLVMLLAVVGLFTLGELQRDSTPGYDPTPVVSDETVTRPEIYENV